jgi:hypothetical protein
MDAPLCRVCHTRHWGNCGTFGATTPKIAKKPLPKSAVVKDVKLTEKIETKVPPAPSIVVGYDFKAAAACPECAERRRKHAERVQRWRAKKGKA